MQTVPFALGDVLKDTVTGLMGTAVARLDSLDGSTYFQIQPHVVVDGIPIKPTWVAEGRLVKERGRGT